MSKLVRRIQVTKMTKPPELIEVALIECVIVPSNQEVICCGKSLGDFKQLKKYLWIAQPYAEARRR